MRRALLTAAVATLTFFALSVPASPRGGIIQIQGAPSGSHLRLTVSAGQLLVNGSPMGMGPAIVVEMGPSEDKIEVLDPLPVPLTAYLGSGSDKLIGNDEPDTCYPQGTARNRCIGGGGDDICISAPVNTDCVGGPGNDYCRTSDGSDGCWGGPGRDECVMGPGQDGCHGDAGNDRLFGGEGADQLYAGGGNDYCDGGPGVGRSHECEAGPRR